MCPSTASWDVAAGDFGQKSDLCVRIREICRNYPEGTSIIKELIQNADDAGARDFKLCLDLRQHGTTSVRRLFASCSFGEANHLLSALCQSMPLNRQRSSANTPSPHTPSTPHTHTIQTVLTHMH